MIYFIQSGSDGPIKIGMSTNPERRLKELISLAPGGLRLLATVPGGKAKEIKLHKQFAEDCFQGEWFQPTPALLSFITDLDEPWNKLIRLEPCLLALLKAAEAIRDDKTKPGFCANEIWYHGSNQDGSKRVHSLKWELCQLVGYYAQSPLPELRTPDAYDIAYETIYKALPDCRNCWCL